MPKPKNKGNSNAIITYDENGNPIDIQDVEIYAKIQYRHFKKGEFFMTHISFPELLLTKKYTGLTYRVLMALQMRIDFNNRIKGFRQSDLAKQLNTSQANISRALKVLEDDKIIYRDGVDYYFSKQYIKGAGDKPKKQKNDNAEEQEDTNETEN